MEQIESIIKLIPGNLDFLHIEIGFLSQILIKIFVVGFARMRSLDEGMGRGNGVEVGTVG